MSWTDDTLSILTDSIGEQGTVFTIKSMAKAYSAGVASGHWTATVRDTATGLAMSQVGRLGRQLVRDRKGENVLIDWKVFFMPTATVEVGDRLYRSGSSEYLEAVSVIRYSDHLEVLAREVTGR